MKTDPFNTPDVVNRLTPKALFLLVSRQREAPHPIANQISAATTGKEVVTGLTQTGSVVFLVTDVGYKRPYQQ